MRRHAVNSSAILTVGYERRSATLEVLFRNGKLYEYFGVEPQEFEALLTAESAGKYLNEVIKPRYQMRQARPDAKRSADRAHPSRARR